MAELIIPTQNPLPVGNGGTGQTTATAAFDALAPSSPAQGDILYYNGTHWVRLAAGTSGQALKTQGAGANPLYDNVSFSIGFAAGGSAGWSPSTSTAYAFANYGLGGNVTAAGSSDNFAYKLPFACTLRAAVFNAAVAGTLSSGETFSGVIRINKTTDTTIFNANLTLNNAASTANANANLPIAFNSGDTILFKTTTPAWVTSPTSVFPQVTMQFTTP